MMRAPSLVQRRHHVSVDDLVAYEAEVAKKLVVMHFTVGLPLLLVMPVTKEGLFALDTHKVLDVPVFSERRHHTLLDGAPARPTYGDAHLVVAAQAVQFVHLVGGVPRPALDLPGLMRQLHLAVGAVEVVRMVGVAAPAKGLAIDHGMALVTHILVKALCLKPGITVMAHSVAHVADEAEVSQLLAAL